MTILQWVLFGCVWWPLSVTIAGVSSESPSGHMDWLLFWSVILWCQVLAAFVLNLAGAW